MSNKLAARIGTSQGFTTEK